MKFLFILIFGLQGFGAEQDQTYLIKHAELSETEFTNFLMANPSYTSVARLPYVKNIDTNLKLLFIEGQKHYVAGAIADAIQIYKKLVDSYLSQDWPQEAQQIIINSFFRLAEIEKSRIDHWLNLAYQFSPTTSPDDEVFSPPLINKWNRIKESTRKVHWNPTLWRDYFQWVKINGTEYSLKEVEKIPLFNGFQRVSFFSNSYKTITIVGSAKDVIAKSPEILPLASGGCEDPRFHSSLGDAVLFSDNCVKGRENKFSRGISKINNYLPEKASVNEKYFKKPSNSSLQKNLNSKTSYKKTRKNLWYRNPWVWGIAAGLGIAIYKQQSEQPTKKAPARMPSHR